MRIIAILLALAVVGLLLSRQLNTSSSTARQASLESDTIETPRVPQAPVGTRDFDQGMNSFIDASKARRDEEIDEKAR